MNFDGRIFRQVLLFTLLILIVPMILFPERLGTNLARTSLLSIAFELVYYGFVIFLFTRPTSLWRLAQFAALGLVYRAVVGVVYSLLIIAMYPMNVSVAFSLGVVSYLPAVLLHIIATPFIVQQIIRKEQPSRPAVSTSPASSNQTAANENKRTTGMASFAFSKEKGYTEHTVPASRRDTKKGEASKSGGGAQSDQNGFDRAARYVCEDGSVKMAAVVDNEGLILGRFSRGGLEPEDIAPFSLLLFERNQEVFSRLGYSLPEKFDLVFENAKIVVAREEAYALMVVSDRAVDDVLNIRINQGLEMIRKYVAERYSAKLIANAEKVYV